MPALLLNTCLGLTFYHFHHILECRPVYALAAEFSVLILPQSIWIMSTQQRHGLHKLGGQKVAIFW